MLDGLGRAIIDALDVSGEFQPVLAARFGLHRGAPGQSRASAGGRVYELKS
ncbi:MAG: hypothetical protein U5L08_14810 [Xanthomonadales bacterium]|nr:hypothetical protein [Xanthomonadales bacterium]